MKQRRELSDILLDIEKRIPGFNREELLEYTNWAILNLHEELRMGNIQQNKVKCTKDLKNKLVENKELYRIKKEVDHISIQYLELYECECENDETYIKVYISLIFYDDTKNNAKISAVEEKYWNDIWVITFREAVLRENEDGNCNNCGAVMSYNAIKRIFKCDYCGNVITTQKWDRDWEIVDIEIKN
jgi:predicted RNA-binding Zn-ribbon protein involved in translation (DUF1610 family)